MSAFRNIVHALKARDGSEVLAVLAAIGLEVLAHIGQTVFIIFRILAVALVMLALAYVTGIGTHLAVNLFHFVSAHR